MATKVPAPREPQKQPTRIERDMRPHAIMTRQAEMKARKAPEPTPEAAAIAASQVPAARHEKYILRGC